MKVVIVVVLAFEGVGGEYRIRVLELGAHLCRRLRLRLRGRAKGIFSASWR